MTPILMVYSDIDSCEPGSACSLKCQNGGKCVRHQGESRCVCRTGFSGESCTQGEVYFISAK